MKILTINLTTILPGYPRPERIAKVRQFIIDNHVDVCCFQEGLNVCWPVYSTPRMLCPPGYNLYHRRYIGFLWFATFQVGVISRYPILDAQAANIEVPQQEWLDWVPLPGRRRVVTVTVEVPGQGPVTLASVHMSSSPKTQEDRAGQFDKLTDFLQQIPDPLIVGGDFNTELSNSAMDVLTDAGFEPLSACSSPDYIFGRGVSLVSRTASLVLNDGTVTDHAGGYLVEVE